MSQTEELFIGLMSGTSVDAIDAALVGFESSTKLRVIETRLTPFPEALRAEIKQTALNNSHLLKNEDSALHLALAEVYADAALNLIKAAGIDRSSITAIANHGQTVRHEPNAKPPFSLQLGDGQRIANITGIKTITQFRQADLAADGQGAPLMPAFHKAVFEGSESTFVLNLGGIANITQLGKTVVGFDTGPGNCLLDQWIAKQQNKNYDENGMWAASGQVDTALLEQLMQESYLHHPHPKSTGTDYFNLDWLAKRIANIEKYTPQDIQATLLAFTVESIALAFKQLNAQSGEIYVCGGGAANATLMQALETRFSSFTVSKTDHVGIPSDWLEAVGFAWLGYCYAHNIPGNLPSVTGASRAVILGQSYVPAVKI